MKKKAIRKCPRIFLTIYFEILDYNLVIFRGVRRKYGKKILLKELILKVKLLKLDYFLTFLETVV